MKNSIILTLGLFLTLQLPLPALASTDEIRDEQEKMDIAATLWRDAAQKVRSLVDQAKDASSKIVSSRNEIARLNNLIKNLVNEKQDALYDLEHGYYCSQCGRSAHEIESQTTETFDEHVNRVGGVQEPASQEKIDKKMEEFDRKITTLENEKRVQEENYENNRMRRYQLGTAALNAKLFEVLPNAVSEIDHYNTIAFITYQDKTQTLPPMIDDVLIKKQNYQNAKDKNLPPSVQKALKIILDNKIQTVWAAYKGMREEHDAQTRAGLERIKQIKNTITQLSMYMGTLDEENPPSGSFLQNAGDYVLRQAQEPKSLRDLIIWDGYSTIYLWREENQIPDVNSL